MSRFGFGLKLPADLCNFARIKFAPFSARRSVNTGQRFVAWHPNTQTVNHLRPSSTETGRIFDEKRRPPIVVCYDARHWSTTGGPYVTLANRRGRPFLRAPHWLAGTRPRRDWANRERAYIGSPNETSQFD